MRSLPFPGYSDLVSDPTGSLSFYLPFVSVTIGFLILLIYVIKEKRGLDKDVLGLLVLNFVTLCLIPKGLVRSHPVHMLLATVPAVLLTALSLRLTIRSFIPEKPKYLYLSSVCIGLVVIVCVGCNGMRKYYPYSSTVSSRIFSGGIIGDVPPSLGYFAIGAERIAAIQYLARATNTDDRILSVTGRHDKIFINDNAFYYFANRLPGSRWHLYEPGVQTTLPVQAEMISDIEKSGVEWIVADTLWDGVQEPNMSALSSGVTLLDDYIKANYEAIESFRTITVRKRIDKPHPLPQD